MNPAHDHSHIVERIAIRLTSEHADKASDFTAPTVPFINLLFELVSAFATVGLSTGITADLSTLGQLFLIITMYIGRVGILLLMAAILGDPSPSAIHYPEEDLLTG